MERWKSGWETPEFGNTCPASMFEALRDTLGGEGQLELMPQQGCANLHLHWVLPGGHQKVVRLYLSDPSEAAKEAAFALALSPDLPVPSVEQVFTVQGWTVAVQPWLPGRPLREVLPHCSSLALEHTMHQVGWTMARISQHTFDRPGRLLTTTSGWKVEDCPGSLARCMGEVRERLGGHSLLASKVPPGTWRLVERWLPRLEGLEEASLVHGDMDPANLLVVEDDVGYQVSGVLDGSYAFSGSTLWDVANMLRYAHTMPTLMARALLKGLQAGGVALRDDWPVWIHAINVVALLDLLARTDPLQMPRRMKDLERLLHVHTEAVMRLETS